MIRTTSSTQRTICTITLMNVPSCSAFSTARDDGDEREGEQHENDPAEGEQERGAAELDEVAALLLVVGDVDPGHQAARAARRAPQREQDRDGETPAERAAAGLGQRDDLVAQQRLGRLGQRRDDALGLLGDRRGIGHQSEEADAGDHGREDGEERGVGDPACHDPEVVRRGLLERPPGHLPPALGRDLGGQLGLFAGAVRGVRAGPVGPSPRSARSCPVGASPGRGGGRPVAAPARWCRARPGGAAGGGTGRRGPAAPSTGPCACAARPGRPRPTRAPCARHAGGGAAGAGRRAGRRTRTTARTSGGGTRGSSGGGDGTGRDGAPRRPGSRCRPVQPPDACSVTCPTAGLAEGSAHSRRDDTAAQTQPARRPRCPGRRVSRGDSGASVPARPSRWSRCRAISGETTTVGPSRSRAGT